MAYSLFDREDCDGNAAPLFPESIDMSEPAKDIRSMFCIDRTDENKQPYFEGVMWPVVLFLFTMLGIHAFNLVVRFVNIFCYAATCPNTKFRCRCCCLFCLDKDQLPKADEEEEAHEEPLKAKDREVELNIEGNKEDKKEEVVEEENDSESFCDSESSSLDSNETSSEYSSGACSSESDTPPPKTKEINILPPPPPKKAKEFLRCPFGPFDCTIPTITAFTLLWIILGVGLMGLIVSFPIDEDVEDMLVTSDATYRSILSDAKPAIDNITQSVDSLKSLGDGISATFLEGQESTRELSIQRTTLGNFIRDHDFLGYAIPLDMLNYEPVGVIPVAYNYAELDTIGAELIASRKAARKVLPIRLKSWYDSLIKDFLGYDFGLYFSALTFISVTFVLVMIFRLYYTSCFFSIDTIVFLPVMGCIFLGLLLPVSWAFTRDMCEHPHEFVHAMNADIMAFLPTGFQTPENADYYSVCPETSSPYYDFGQSKVGTAPIELTNNQIRAQISDVDFAKITSIDKKYDELAAKLIEHKQLMRDNKLDLTNYELNMIRNLEEEQEEGGESRRSQGGDAVNEDDLDEDYPDRLPKYNPFGANVNGSYVGRWLGACLVEPINVAQIRRENPSRFRVQLTLAQLDQNIIDIDQSLDMNSVAKARNTQVGEYLSKLREDTEVVDQKYAAVSTAVLSMDNQLTSCTAMKSRLLPMYNRACTELIDDFRIGSGVVFALLGLDLFIILLNYLDCGAHVYTDSERKGCTYACCPCCCKGEGAGETTEGTATSGDDPPKAGDDTTSETAASGGGMCGCCGGSSDTTEEVAEGDQAKEVKAAA